jgi:hypothetical protein
MRAKTTSRPTVNLVPLLHAVLCADCELISEGTNGHCVACGSQAVISISKVLGGTAAKTPPEPPRLAPESDSCEQPESVRPVKRLSPQVA